MAMEPPDGAVSLLESLPVELTHSIIGLLNLDDFKHVRLTSRYLAQVSRPFLAPVQFKSPPWSNGMSRLLGLSQIPECASRIRSASFNFASLDEYRALHESFSNFYLLEPELRTETLRKEWTGYLETQRAATRDGSTIFPTALVERAVGGLRGLRSLSLRWRECAWKGEEVNRVFDGDESVRKAGKSAEEVQRAFLGALWTLDAPLETLEIDAWALTPEGLRDLHDKPTGEAFRSLRRFTVRMESLEESENSPKAAFDAVVSRMPNLEELDCDKWSQGRKD